MPHLQEKGEEENAPPTQNSTPPDSTLQDWRGNRLSEKRKSRDPGGSGAPRQECGGKSCAGGRDSEQTRPPPATAACPCEDVACHPSPEPRSCAHTCSLTRKLFPENPHVSERALKRQK